MILLPYTRLHPATSRLVNRHAPSHWRVRLDPADMSAYWRLLATVWREPGDLIVVEHDIGIHVGVLPGFDACPEPWCGYPYRVNRQVIACLGCTRFTAALKAAEPDLMDAVGERAEGGVMARHWCRLDVRVGDELRSRGYGQHRHEPPVAHYHRYPWADSAR